MSEQNNGLAIFVEIRMGNFPTLAQIHHEIWSSSLVVQEFSIEFTVKPNNIAH